MADLMATTSDEQHHLQNNYACNNVFNYTYSDQSYSTNFNRQEEILNWVNNYLQTDYKKIEELCNGAAYAQLMDLLFPGIVPLKEIKFCTNLEHERIQNFKVVQSAFERVGCDKEIPIDKLVKSRFQDNFEFLQWFKEFFDANYDGHEYNALEARGTVLLKNLEQISESDHGRTSEQQSTSKHDTDHNKQLVLLTPTYSLNGLPNNLRDSDLQGQSNSGYDDDDEYDRSARRSLVDHAWSKRILELVGNKAKLLESFSWLSTVGGGFSSLGERDRRFSSRAGALSLGQQLHLAELLGDERLKVMCHLFAALAALQMENKQFCLNYIKRVIVPLINSMPYRDPILTNILRHIFFRMSVMDRFVGTQNAIEDSKRKQRSKAPP